MSITRDPQAVSAVICSLNSVASIERCLRSLRDIGVGELIVVDAHSSDGTREIANRIADRVLDDPGTGLGNARNIGIAQTSKPLILNMGSDNVMPPGQLERMIEVLERDQLQGVSAQTIIEGDDYFSRGLDAWRRSRFQPGPAQVIGTPTLFEGDLLRKHPYDAQRQHSDDSELCERWERQFGARFAISDAYVLEIGKTSLSELVTRCHNYGISDEEIFRAGRKQGWSTFRQIRSLLHPLRVDFLTPMGHLGLPEALKRAPFFAGFTALRYGYWARTSVKRAWPSQLP